MFDIWGVQGNIFEGWNGTVRLTPRSHVMASRSQHFFENNDIYSIYLICFISRTKHTSLIIKIKTLNILDNWYLYFYYSIHLLDRYNFSACVLGVSFMVVTSDSYEFWLQGQICRRLRWMLKLGSDRHHTDVVNAGLWLHENVRLHRISSSFHRLYNQKETSTLLPLFI